MLPLPWGIATAYVDGMARTRALRLAGGRIVIPAHALTWQFACREEHIPEVGDYYVYDIGRHSFIVTRVAKDAVRQKVAALYPAHEVEQFTELFWGRIQRWRTDTQASA